MKRGVVGVLLCALLSVILVSGGIIAPTDVDNSTDVNTSTESTENTTGTTGTSTDTTDDVFEELEEEYADEVITDPGLTPDSVFYFIDEIFDRFGSEIENREERIAEIKAMVEKGDYLAAKKALDRYKENAKALEKDVDPDKRDEARRSAAVIRKALNEIKDQIPEEEREEFYDNILEKESAIVTAVEISSKIKDLCVQLAELDPMEYSRICKIEGDVPDWRKKLNKDLTEGQIEEAKKFGDIMSECFQTSGNNCRCEDISFYDFSVACSKVAPLASKCDAGSEDACDMMDEIEMPELPPHLQEILDDIERKYGEARYEMHMPPECIKEGAETPKDCMLIMVRIHAPFECKDAIKEAIESGEIKDERGARDICDRIMMPPECKGMNPDECARNMMPPECLEKDLSPRECKNFMDSSMRPGPGPGFGRDCGEIQDPMERLECYDGMGEDMGEQYGIGPGFKASEGEITWQCKENRIHWPPDCEKFMREELPEQERRMDEERRKNEEKWKQDEEKWKQEWEGEKPWEREHPQEGDDFRGGPGFDDNYEESECKDGCSQECGDQNTDCVNGRCVCLGYGENGPPTQSEEPEQPIEEEQTPPLEEQEAPPSEEEAPVVEEVSTGVTGGVISNLFWDYYT